MTDIVNEIIYNSWKIFTQMILQACCDSLSLKTFSLRLPAFSVINILQKCNVRVAMFSTAMQPCCSNCTPNYFVIMMLPLDFKPNPI